MQRVNGRVAMWGFLAGIAAEAASHKSILEQLSGAWGNVVFFMVLISAASLIPKYAAGVSLASLNKAAKAEVSSAARRL